MRQYGKVKVRIGLGLVLCSVLGVGVVSAKVQVLPETTLLVEEKKITGQKRLQDHRIVKELLASFERAETALRKEDIDALMKFYAPTYDYHGLKGTDVRRVWGEVFEHYKALESLHLFSDIKVVPVNNELRLEVTCTGGLYGTDERTGNRITLDSWFREVHYLVKEDGAWRFLGNAGEVPTGAPVASAPHHPLF
ncbi:MAG: nuclear transport factor 2 family protein [Nitrospira sp.]|nr:nuclear transport factor 2 family protein [Nitrospira sp.]